MRLTAINNFCHKVIILVSFYSLLFNIDLMGDAITAINSHKSFYSLLFNIETR